MTAVEYANLTQEQRDALDSLAERGRENVAMIIERATAPTALFNYVGVPDWCGMFIGIESDGYTHS